MFCPLEGKKKLTILCIMNVYKSHRQNYKKKKTFKEREEHICNLRNCSRGKEKLFLNIILNIVSNLDKVLTEQAGPFIDYNTLIFSMLQSVDFDKEFVDAISASPCGEMLLGD